MRALLAIGNHRACEALAERGDDPEQSRSLEHLAEFGAESDALAFSAALRGMNFSVSAPAGEQDEGRDGDRVVDGSTAFAVRFSRPDRPTDMDAVTASLADLAEEHAGIYRSWSAPVVA